MGYIPEYECDIFISYSHKDNISLPGAARGWVDAFQEALENWLRYRRGFSNLIIWRDKALNGNTLFDLSIENRLKSSALFFALTSSNYLKSDYCRKELQFFRRFAGSHPGGLQLGEDIRIFNILLRNIPHAEWPEEAAGIPGFPMHDSQDIHDLGDFISPKSELFETQLRAVVDAVEKMFGKFKDADAVEAKLSDDSEENKVRIYLADVADDLASHRKRLAADLSLKGIEILPYVPPPYDDKEHESSLNQALRQAQLSVHMLGRWPGRPLANWEDTTYAQEQVRIALATPTPQVIWLPADLTVKDIEDTPYRLLLEQLESGSREEKRFDLLRGTPSTLTEFLRQKIQGLNTSPASLTPETVLIDTHQKDQSYAYRLADALVRKGLDVEFNKESRDPIQSLNNFEAALRQVHNLVIMFGSVAPDWLHGRIKKAVKVAAEQFDTDTSLLLQNIWILLLPPSGGRYPLQSLPSIIHVDVLDNSHSDDIDSFVVTRLLQARTSGGRG